MEKAFWVERWTTGQTGFHQGAPNALLVAHHAHIAGARRVYVPLCGKAVDLVWLRQHGHDVTGSEIVPEAITQLFAEHHLAATTTAATAASGASFRDHAAAATADAGTLHILEGDALAVDEAVFAAV